MEDLATSLGGRQIPKATTLRPRNLSYLLWQIIKTCLQPSTTYSKNLLQFVIIQSKNLIFTQFIFFTNLLIIVQIQIINNLLVYYYFLFSIGPIFGAGADLLIASNCNVNVESYSNLPHSYDGENASNSILMGDYYFSVVDYEVFAPCLLGSKSNH